MKKTLVLALLLTATLFGQFDNTVAGWGVDNDFIVPNTTYVGEMVVADESSLGSETLDEVDFATDATWGRSNDITYNAGVDFGFVWSAWQTSELEQLDADYLTVAVGSRWYKFTYTIALTTAFDGDGVATITTAFALTAVSLDLTTGTHTVYFKSAVTPTDFVISVVSGSDTEGTFTIDDVTLKEITGGDGYFAGNLAVGSISVPSGYTRHITMDIGAAILGPTAPTPTTIGTFRGLGFDADNEVVNFHFAIPLDWDGASDMSFHIHWYSAAGDIVANGETVKWDATYRSIAAGEAIDNGTAVSITATLTGGASEIDKEHYETSITIDYDNANQPLAVGDDLGVQFDRDVTGDTYSGAGIVHQIHLEYTANALPEG